MNNYRVKVAYPASTTYNVQAENPEKAIDIATMCDAQNVQDIEISFESEPTFTVMDENGNILHDVNPPYNILKDTLNSVIDHISAGENTSGQINTLLDMGFTEDLLVFFGYSKTDIEETIKERKE